MYVVQLSGMVVELTTRFIKFEEFPVDIPHNLDDEDRTHWVRIREGRQSPRTSRPHFHHLYHTFYNAVDNPSVLLAHSNWLF